MYILLSVLLYIFFGKGKGQGTCCASAYMSQNLVQKRFTMLEVAADWHELMIPWRIMRPSIARANKQLYPQCSTQTYHRPNQPHWAFAP